MAVQLSSVAVGFVLGIGFVLILVGVVTVYLVSKYFQVEAARKKKDLEILGDLQGLEERKRPEIHPTG